MATNSPTELITRARRSVPLPKELDPIGAALTRWNDDLQPPLEPPVKKPVPRKGKARVVPPVQQVAAKPPAPPPLAMPLLTGAVQQRLMAVPRRFNHAFLGGKPPFTVTLALAEGQHAGTPEVPSTWTFQVGDERVVSSIIDPATGLYDLRVTDAAGATVQARIAFVAAQPSIDTHDLEDLPRGIARVVAGARLANMDGGVWRMEAETRLADEGRDNYAAALMAARLLAGNSLPDPLLAPASPPVAAAPIAASSAPGAAAR